MLYRIGKKVKGKVKSVHVTGLYFVKDEPIFLPKEVEESDACRKLLANGLIEKVKETKKKNENKTETPTTEETPVTEEAPVTENKTEETITEEPTTENKTEGTTTEDKTEELVTEEKPVTEDKATETPATEDKKFKCPKCDKEYKSMSSLKAHMKKAHPEE